MELFLKRPALIAIPARSPVHCVVDAFEEGQVRGWAFDPTANGQPARFYVLVDGEQTNEIICRGPRPDVAQAGAWRRRSSATAPPCRGS